jgi:hypothetical protein
VDAAISGDINTIDSLLLRRDGCFRGVDFEVLVIFVKPRQPQSGAAFSETEGDAFAAQGDHLDLRVCRDSQEIARIDL